MAFQLAQRLGAGQPLGGVLLLLDALGARLAGSALVAGGRWPKVPGRLPVDSLRLKRAVIDAGLYARLA